MTITRKSDTINTELLEEKGLKVPTVWTDLLQPELKGEVSMSNPASSGTAYNVVSAVLQTNGEAEGWAYLDKLIGQVPFFTARGSDPANMVVNGEAIVGINASNGDRIFLSGFIAEVERTATLRRYRIKTGEGVFDAAEINRTGRRIFSEGEAVTLGLKTGTFHYLQEDLLCFGLDSLPDTSPRAEELTVNLEHLGGASIAAHPFRANGRGMGELFLSFPCLSAVEGFNGNTADEANLRAVRLAEAADLALTGGSDAHRPDRIGCFATEFPGPVQNTRELSAALRSDDFRPVKSLAGCFQSCR